MRRSVAITIGLVPPLLLGVLLLRVFFLPAYIYAWGWSWPEHQLAPDLQGGVSARFAGIPEGARHRRLEMLGDELRLYLERAGVPLQAVQPAPAGDGRQLELSLHFAGTGQRELAAHLLVGVPLSVVLSGPETIVVTDISEGGRIDLERVNRQWVRHIEWSAGFHPPYIAPDGHGALILDLPGLRDPNRAARGLQQARSTPLRFEWRMDMPFRPSSRGDGEAIPVSSRRAEPGEEWQLEPVDGVIVTRPAPGKSDTRIQLRPSAALLLRQRFEQRPGQSLTVLSDGKPVGTIESNALSGGTLRLLADDSEEAADLIAAFDQAQPLPPFQILSVEVTGWEEGRRRLRAGLGLVMASVAGPGLLALLRYRRRGGSVVALLVIHLVFCATSPLVVELLGRCGPVVWQDALRGAEFRVRLETFYGLAAAVFVQACLQMYLLEKGWPAAAGADSELNHAWSRFQSMTTWVLGVWLAAIGIGLVTDALAGPSRAPVQLLVWLGTALVLKVYTPLLSPPPAPAPPPSA